MIIRSSGFIFLALILTGFFLIAKIKPKRIKACGVFVIIISLLISVLIPPFAIKKEIMTFDDPESALMYYEKKDNLNVVAKVYGKESCMMRFYNGKYDFGFSKKTDEGWKLVPLHFSSYKTIYNEILGGKSIVVYHIKGTQDYYVNISAFSSDEIAVSDNNGTVFHTYSDDHFIIYMGYVHNLGDEYKIFVGEETVDLSRENI